MKASAGKRSAAVLKPHQSTPARRPSNDTVAPLANVVTPCRTSDASTDSTVVEEGEVNRNLEESGQNSPLFPKPGEPTDILDDLSALSTHSALDEDLSMPPSTKNSAAKKLTATELQKKLRSMELEVANLRSSLKSKDEDIIALETSHKSKIGAMTKEVKEVRHQMTVLCSNTPNSDLLKSYAAKFASLEQQIADLKESHAKELVEAYTKNGSLSTENAQLRCEKDKLAKKLSTLEESSDSVEGPQNQRLQAKITDLEAKRLTRVFSGRLKISGSRPECANLGQPV